MWACRGGYKRRAGTLHRHTLRTAAATTTTTTMSGRYYSDDDDSDTNAAVYTSSDDDSDDGRRAAELSDDEAGVPVARREPAAPAQASGAAGATPGQPDSGGDAALPTPQTHPDNRCMVCAQASAQPRTCPQCRMVVLCSDACFARCKAAHAQLCPLLHTLATRARPLSEPELQRLGLARTQIAAPEFADDAAATPGQPSTEAAASSVGSEAAVDAARRGWRGGWGWGGRPWRGGAWRGWRGGGGYFGHPGFAWGLRPCWWYLERGLPCPYGAGVRIGPFSAGIAL